MSFFCKTPRSLSHSKENVYWDMRKFSIQSFSSVHMLTVLSQNSDCLLLGSSQNRLSTLSRLRMISPNSRNTKVICLFLHKWLTKCFKSRLLLFCSLIFVQKFLIHNPNPTISESLPDPQSPSWIESPGKRRNVKEVRPVLHRSSIDVNAQWKRSRIGFRLI